VTWVIVLVLLALGGVAGFVAGVVAARTYDEAIEEDDEWEEDGWHGRGTPVEQPPRADAGSGTARQRAQAPSPHNANQEV
jgi:hypothetical protein